MAIGIKAIGGTGGVEVGYLLMLRFVIVVPITLAGSDPDGRPATAGCRNCAPRAPRPGADHDRHRRPHAVDRLDRGPPRAARRRSPAAWFAAQDKREVALWGALIAAALIVRVIGLGDRPFHHDESQDAYFSYLFRQTGDYEYNPLLHGPLRFYLTGLMYVLFGDSNFTARLAPVLMGLAMIPMCWRPAPRSSGAIGGLRRRRAARLRPELPVLLALRPRGHLRRLDHARADRRHLALPRGAAQVPPGDHRRAARAVLRDQGDDVHHGLRDGLVLPRRARGPGHAAAGLGPGDLRAGWEGWGWFLAAFAGLFTILFTTFLTHPGGLWDGIYTGLKYWLGQHDVARGGEPWVFYRRADHVEWPALLLGVDRHGDALAPPAAADRVPGLGLRALARGLLVGGREVRLARPAPAAAARPAGRRGHPGRSGRPAARCAGSGSRCAPWRWSTSPSRPGG